VLKKDKERIVAELTERLRMTDSLIVTDYRGLSVSEMDDLRTKLIEVGARFSVVKNTLTRLAVEAAGTTELLELLDGPTAIAFVQPGSDPAAVAKVLSETARTGRVLVIRGGLFERRPMADSEVEELAKLPPADVLRGQVLGAIVAPLNAIAALVNAPLQDLVGLIDARIEQLGGEAAEAEPAPGAETESAVEAAEAEAEPEATGDADVVEETETPEAEEAPVGGDEEEE
jgi:large subunit ribosomal protein L10